MAEAKLVCTEGVDPYDPGSHLYEVGVLLTEGDLKTLVEQHVRECGEHHRHAICVIIQGDEFWDRYHEMYVVRHIRALLPGETLGQEMIAKANRLFKYRSKV